jgi:hypothetical protein
MTTRRDVIFVRLVDEDVDVWRPVQAVRLHDEVYRIADQIYDSDIETWEFEPNDEVVGEMIDSADGSILAATARANRERP